jgi:co-chaperonin GroES (HSP10)
MAEESLGWYFPKVDPGALPLGGRVIVQYRRVKLKSAGGIILQDETRETEKWNTQVAMVVAVGPLAFKKRDTMEPWPEGTWADPGDFVRVPKYGGDRWEVGIDGEEEPALFGIFNDHELIAKVTGDPLRIKAYID